ncbi:MAG TPA: 4Fe-4S dicluster domain-containing protein [Nocardioidaceae bacterium]|nr:4Fe-4S dicluster domain-containing protein [Nocardioidaceae bacterium]
MNVAVGDRRQIDLSGLQGLIDVLAARGYTVLGPTVRDGAIVQAPIHVVDDLPRGWGDDQEAGQYRLRRRDDEALFGFASGAQSAKPVFFPAETLLWRGRRDHQTFSVEAPDGSSTDQAGKGGPPYAVLGVRSCDLCAIGVQDTVLAGRTFTDADYQDRRAGSFIVAVTCSDPGGTCFCVSMDTGPRPQAGRGAAFDVALTELIDERGHRFLVEVGTERGADLLAELAAPSASAEDLGAADDVAATAAERMGRELDTAGIKELLYASAESPRWDDVASRCLSCTNCTAVCPTCFCTSVEDVSDLSGDQAERNRIWDSCFNAEFSYIHGGTVRESPRSRYRQWLTHKLASWIDQFGTSGCVGCGRCITWCPAAIDLTVEVAALRESAPTARSDD